MITGDVDSIFSGDFAQEITHHYGESSTESIQGIFMDPYESMELSGVAVESALPSVLIKTSQAGNVDRESSYFTIESTTYHIVELENDDNGITKIYLSQDNE